jgi:FkbM family methyltransferase
MIPLLSKIKKKFILQYRRVILRDPFLLEVNRWFRDKGDKTLRLDYPLTPESVVFDLGGYHGDFAAAMNERYGCKVYIFEPVPEFHQKCVARFKGNHQIVCMNYGLSSADEWLNIDLAENASSFAFPQSNEAKQLVEVRSIVECIYELKIERIDLMKINIEGGEFEVIPAIIESGDLKKVHFLQIQFHNFIEHATNQRKNIRNQLANTHTEMWNYDFVWESWERKNQD